ncbi:suppressor of exocyst mutations 1 [Brevipalpus obovatus]|uniref:suppressor of exocyst mutations 1 n=1 Tax=Brevipalpus obovatus TaxID=246614 RepID=UPI003D9DB8C4
MAKQPPTESKPFSGAKVDLTFEEDDEFEEFPAEEWQEKKDDQELTIWEDNWDDDDMKDDFSEQLKRELQKRKIVTS